MNRIRLNGQIKETLKRELAGELPGKDAQALMMPIARDKSIRLPQFLIAPVKSAVLILLYPDHEGNIKFPLIQRPDYEGAHSGQISLPGGKIEHSDAGLTETALRETEEEIGVKREKVEVIGSLTNLYITVSNYDVTPVIGFTDQKPHFFIDETEVAELIEADLADLLSMEKLKEGDVLVRGKYKVRTPYFDIGGYMVWGATAMILSEFSVILRRSGILDMK